MIISILLELSLRILPLKGIEFKSGKFDNDIKLYLYEPNSIVKLTNIRNERIFRTVNSSGFLDVDHKTEKKQGMYRIGFFGDSYVEANQVLLDDTFFRKINKNLSHQNFEIFAFGNSGWGTAHSYLVSKKFSEKYDLDLIVYVFTENDLGDQIYEIKQVESLPYPKISDNNRIVIDTTRVTGFVQQRSRYRFFEYFYRKSSLLQNIYRRYNMLIKYGIKTSVNENDVKMSSFPIKNKYPNQNDLPSAWPDNYINQSKLLFEKMIYKWEEEVRKSNKKFAIMYVPRESEWMKSDAEQDSWKNWLIMISNL